MVRYYLCMVVLALFSIAFFHEASVVGQGASNSFRIDESFVGPGGALDSSSSAYQFQSGQQSTGSPGAVESASTNFASQGGYTTTEEPRLACILNTSSINLGALSTSISTTATATFSVLNYTSYGYIVSIVGSPPTMGSYTLRGLNPAEQSNPSTEQFGINLVNNAAPDIGSDPVQVPDGTFSSGTVTDSYNDADWFRYVPGETIASALASSGQTNYTISYLVNISATTAGGSYTGNQTIVCTGTY